MPGFTPRLNGHDRRALLKDAQAFADVDELVASLYVSPLGVRQSIVGRRDGATVYTTTLARGRE